MLQMRAQVQASRTGLQIDVLPVIVGLKENEY